jgi:hypothetical protein
VKYTEVGIEPNEGAGELPVAAGALLSTPAFLLGAGWLLVGTWPVPASCGA